MRLNILKDGKRANQAVVRKTKCSPSKICDFWWSHVPCSPLFLYPRGEAPVKLACPSLHHF